jgi:hypothetical protein
VPTTLSSPQIFTNFETASALLVTRNVTSTSVVTERPIYYDESNPTDAEEFVRTTQAPTRKQRQNDELNSPTYDYYYSETTPTYYDYDESETTNAPTVALILSTTPSPIEAFLKTTTTTESPVVSEEITTVQPTTTTTEATTTTSTTTTTTTTTPATTTTSESPKTFETDDTTLEATTTSSVTETSDRSPRTSDVDKWDKNDEQHLDEKEPDIFSGKYYEINPGQYFDDNTGQYHEANPGQYLEANPGQYYDPHLAHGQYAERNPGQYNDQLDVQVTLIQFVLNPSISLIHLIFIDLESNYKHNSAKS